MSQNSSWFEEVVRLALSGPGGAAKEKRSLVAIAVIQEAVEG